MLVVISPAKTLDFTSEIEPSSFTQPDLLDKSEALLDVLVTKSPDDIQKLMKISPALAELNVERYQQWSRPFTKENARQAALAFKGDVYTGLEFESFTEKEQSYAQEHLRILSGLYGVLRPLDLMQAYRLEMGIKLENPSGTNLYQFWGHTITDTLNQQLKSLDSDILVNLASNEYFKSVKKRDLHADIVTPAFKDWKNGQYKMISFFAKKARGLMTSWILKNQVKDLESLAEFNLDGYQFSPNDSDPLNPLFTRKQDN